jgi:hypothetical protein
MFIHVIINGCKEFKKDVRDSEVSYIDRRVREEFTKNSQLERRNFSL